MSFSAAVITVSDMGARGEREDTAGDALEQLLHDVGAGPISRVIVPDERDRIIAALDTCIGEGRVDLVITTGGTGFATRDVTPEATREVIEREAPGIAEAIRARSLEITSRAMLSRAVSGIAGSTLIVNFPGSEKACRESFPVLAPVLGHALELLAGDSGDCAR
jgi:molybdenum cofactor synthesis domain-containing protein